MVVFEFEKLDVYQDCREFRRRIYKLSALLPRDEFKLKSQMRDAARSLTNCIAEGYGRYTYPDRIHFCRQSRGSLLEFVDDVSICENEQYAKPEHLATLRDDAARVLKRMNAYIKYLELQSRTPNSPVIVKKTTARECSTIPPAT
jgi:four helix bundle protein